MATAAAATQGKTQTHTRRCYAATNEKEQMVEDVGKNGIIGERESGNAGGSGMDIRKIGNTCYVELV